MVDGRFLKKSKSHGVWYNAAVAELRLTLVKLLWRRSKEACNEEMQATAATGNSDGEAENLDWSGA
jgi:hypothetical protein